jgi:hypothetical protein
MCFNVEELMMNRNEEIPEFSIRYLNTTSLAGIVIFSLTSIAYYFGLSTITRSSFIVFDPDVKYTEGIVVSRSEIGLSEGGESSRHAIFEITFSYQVGNMTYTNRGYTTSSSIGPGHRLHVSYKETNPKISKAATLRASPFGVYIIIGIILPMAGVLIFLKGLRRGNNFITILKNLQITEGHLLKVVQNGDNYLHYYWYKDVNGTEHRLRSQSSVKEAEEKVRVLYNVQDPAKAEVLLIDTLPFIFGKNKLKRLLQAPTIQ